MNVSIIGASKGVGLCTVKRALAHGHAVTTLSRSQIPLTPNFNLHPLKGSATREADLEQAIEGASAIIVALGRGMDTSATTLYSDFAQTLLRIHERQPITAPVVILTGFGAGDSGQYHTFLNLLLFKFILNKVYADKTRMEQMIAQSTLRWEFVRPGTLTNQPLTEKYRVETILHKNIRIGSISRMDVADFMLKQAENPTLLGHYPALSKK